MKPNQQLSIDYLKELPLFRAVSNENIRAIAENSYVESLKKNEMLFFQGDPAEKCYIVLHGIVKIYLESGKSHESIISIAAENDLLGDISIHEGVKFLTSAQVMEDTKILTIPASVLRKSIFSNSQLATNLLKTVSCSMQSLVRQIEHQTLMTAPQRVGCLLLKLYKSQNPQKNNIVYLPCEKRLIAARLQMSPETFSRALDTLKEHGIALKQEGIAIVNEEQLGDYACSSCSHICIPGEAFFCSSIVNFLIPHNTHK